MSDLLTFLFHEELKLRNIHGCVQEKNTISLNSFAKYYHNICPYIKTCLPPFYFCFFVFGLVMRGQEYSLSIQNWCIKIAVCVQVLTCLQLFMAVMRLERDGYYCEKGNSHGECVRTHILSALTVTFHGLKPFNEKIVQKNTQVYSFLCENFHYLSEWRNLFYIRYIARIKLSRIVNHNS